MKPLLLWYSRFLIEKSTELQLTALTPAAASEDLWIFFGFSQPGKCDSSGDKSPALTLKQAAACLLSVLSDHA